MQWIALRDREPEPDSIVVFRNCYNSYSVGPACRLGKVNTDDGLQFFRLWAGLCDTLVPAPGI